MWETIPQLYTNSRLIALVSVFVGCYILRDVVRVVLIFLESAVSGSHDSAESVSANPGTTDTRPPSVRRSEES